ncbi:putative lyase [Marinomonas aquimarina]|uniref:Putative lyase n=1 Tax=Marinomonas aquimarina TaxID=295068 RepID=A0A1A8SZU1_9GAMM|nr:VOC family protein [Marinomonas aquimarina]SBS24739.1 putative lyase [Marinomonas aquimarina]
MCVKQDQVSPLQIQSVHHVAIICSDYPRSKAFYCELLGFAVIQETYRAERDSYKLDLKVNDQTQLELFSFPNAPQRPSYPEAQGLRHLAFATDDLEQAVAYLKHQQIAVETIRTDELTGKRFTFFTDPDGLPLELYQA